jgi:outer membrane cobalamin receptor
VAQESQARFEDRDADVVSSSRTRSLRASAKVTQERWALVGSIAREWMPDEDRTQLSVRADARRDWTSHQGTRVLTLGFGQEVVDGEYFALPRLGLLRVLGGLEASMSAGRTVRHPSFVERFWLPGGNPNLRAETGWGGEAKLAGSLGWARAEVTGFLARLTNRIVWHPSLVSAGLQVWSPINVGNSVSQGVEVRLALGGNRRGMTLEGTWTSATDRTDDKAASFGHQLRYTPRLVSAAAAWVTVREVVVTTSVKRTGSRPIASDGSFSEPAFVVADATLSHSMTAFGLSNFLSVSVANLFDADYAVVRLYPMPGRHLTFTLRIDLQ